MLGNGAIIVGCSVAHSILSLLNKAVENIQKDVKYENYDADFDGADTVDYVFLAIAFFCWLSTVGWFVLAAQREQLASGRRRSGTSIDANADPANSQQLHNFSFSRQAWRLLGRSSSDLFRHTRDYDSSDLP